MNRKLKLALSLAGLYLLLAVLFGALVLVLWMDMREPERDAVLAIMENRYVLAILIILLAWAVLGFIVQGLYEAYVRAPLSLREQALVMVEANPGLRLQEIGASEIRTLAHVVNALAEQREALQRDVEAKIREAKASIEEEKNRLAALMSELTQSVVVCNLDGRILLYNNRARLQFRALGDGGTAGGAGPLIGLGRSIFGLLERGLITHALENIQHRLKRSGSQPVANFVTTTRAGQLLRAQMAAVLSSGGEEVPGGAPAPRGEGERQITGYVLMLDNITRNFETETRRDQMLESLTEGTRAPLASVRAAVETLANYPDMEAEQRDRFVSIIGEEVRKLSHHVDRTMTEYADAMKTRWPLEEMLGADLVGAGQRRIEAKVGIRTKTQEIDSGLWIKVDSFSLLQGLNYLSTRLHEEFAIREVRFRLARDGNLAHLDLMWAGSPMGVETMHAWEEEPMNLGGETSLLTLRDVMDRHGGEIWYQYDKPQQSAFFRLLLPSAMPQEEMAADVLLRSDSRPEYYDFDLFQRREQRSDLDDVPLTELTFTVFDTETTGLEPSAGDEIIQFGAVRIVNGRLLRSESFEQLVDPQRRLKPESIPIHGITDAMVRGQPTIHKVLPAFAEFCADTVLVAHNAAFDMRFLQMKEEPLGIRFDHPVLDTLLLSAVIHPNQESHKLEAIAERLGINVIGRHTALGDAIVTGEVFLKMLPLLTQQGIQTLRQAREAAEKTYYARVKY
ncbi:MAG: DNA polymerase III subunit epsilon [Betaproteobacteria bacterium]|nr:DNA polymerase III subunit epsilon [Betaproteobacteria bacterium]